MKVRQFTAICILLLFLLQAGCISGGSPDSEGASVTAPSSVWIPYWDYADAVSEIRACGDGLCDLVAFAAVMEKDGTLFFPDGMEETVNALVDGYGTDKSIFLSATNDVLQDDGTYIQKDVNILHTLFESDESIDAHIDDLLSLCLQYKVDGLEIDYEALGKDTELWSAFVHFTERLYARTEEEGLRLRIVLGAYSADYATFIEGPEYVIMCYNLYGAHSGAGPKADKKFLNETYDRNSTLPGDVQMAFASGGYDWSSDGKCHSLTQVEAEQLREEYNISDSQITRDEASRSLVYTYEKDGLQHEVWYADGETLSYWIGLANEAGYSSTAIWRLGGNRSTQLRELFGG